MQIFDYIIVGAGASGCVLAYRLSENPANKVLLLEAGGPDKHPMIAMPKGIAQVMANPNYTWPFQIQAETGSNNIEEVWVRGRTLGGSSAINGAMYVRGQCVDYDALAELSSDDWNWKNIGKSYRELEQHQLGASATRGDSGPLRITLPEKTNALIDAVIAAGEAQGLEVKEDVNDPEDCERIGYASRTIYRGRRQSAAKAFLKPIRDRSNLTIKTGFKVDKVLFKAKKAVGLQGLEHDLNVSYGANKEVIICAGALASPSILQRSGIGSTDVLESLNINVVHNNPQVGENLREHRGLVMQWRVPDELSENAEYSGIHLLKNVIKYYVTHKGPLAAGAYEAGAWFKSRPELDRPDGQLLIAPFTFDYTAEKLELEKQGGLNFVVYPLRPESKGSVKIKSSDLHDLPIINANYSTAKSDRRKMIDIVRYARKLVAAISSFKAIETRPGVEYQSDEQITQAHCEFGFTSYHASGTCRMGNDADAVVDAELKVNGVEGLRVVDTSVFPFILAGNTNAPATVVAWRAADLILGGH